MPVGEKASVENGPPRHGAPGCEAGFLGEGFTEQCELGIAPRNAIARMCDQSGNGSFDERVLESATRRLALNEKLADEAHGKIESYLTSDETGIVPLSGNGSR